MKFAFAKNLHAKLIAFSEYDIVSTLIIVIQIKVKLQFGLSAFRVGRTNLPIKRIRGVTRLS